MRVLSVSELDGVRGGVGGGGPHGNPPIARTNCPFETRYCLEW